ncbi:MAG: TIR domain-containing protein [Kineosporiaceae bacterium]|nr:TIR domain-containing protein [Kineosporiaceae bacterium]
MTELPSVSMEERQSLVRSGQITYRTIRSLDGTVIGYRVFTVEEMAGQGSPTAGGGAGATAHLLLDAARAAAGARAAEPAPLWFLPAALDAPAGAPTSRLILEIGEMEMISDVTTVVAGLHGEGHRLALSGFRAGRGNLHDRLVALADHIMIPIHGADEGSLARLVEALRSAESPPLLIATDVNDPQDQAVAERLQMDGVERPLHTRAITVEVRRIREVAAVHARLAAELNRNNEAIVNTIAELIQGDPGLTHAALRASNVAANTLGRSISSVREAVVLLGLDAVRGWVMLDLLDRLAPGETDLVVRIVREACRHRNLARLAGLSPTNAESAFLVGLLRWLAFVLGDGDVRSVVQALPVDAGVSAQATGDSDGPLARVVRWVETGEAPPEVTVAPAQVQQAEASALLEALELVGPPTETPAERPPRPVSTRVYVVHASEDRPTAERLANDLRLRGFTVPGDFDGPPDLSVEDALREVITGADSVIALMSHAFFASRWCDLKVLLAREAGRPLVPVLIVGEPEGPFAHGQYLDARQIMVADLARLVQPALAQKVPTR